MYVVVIAVVVAGMLYINGLRLTIEQQRTTIVKLQGENKNLQTANTQLHSANEKLVAAIDRQNAAVTKIVNDVEARKLASDTALRAARAENDKLRKRYASILNVPPSIPGDECASTSVLLNQYIEMRKGEPQ